MSFQFGVPQAGRVTLSVYDVAGRLVNTTLDGVLASGVHLVVWDTRNRDGSLVPSGVYYRELRSEEQAWERPLVILR